MILKLSLMLMCWNLKFCELKQHFTREPDNQVNIFMFSLTDATSILYSKYSIILI